MAVRPAAALPTLLRNRARSLADTGRPASPHFAYVAGLQVREAGEHYLPDLPRRRFSVSGRNAKFCFWLREGSQTKSFDRSRLYKVEVPRNVFPFRPDRHTAAAGQRHSGAGVLQRRADEARYLLGRRPGNRLHSGLALRRGHFRVISSSLRRRAG
jgi:hypothetical protein